MRGIARRPPAGIASARRRSPAQAPGRSARRSRGPALARGCDPRRAQGRRTPRDHSGHRCITGPSPTQRPRRPPWTASGLCEVACRPPAGIAFVRVDPRAQIARGDRRGGAGAPRLRGDATRDDRRAGELSVTIRATVASPAPRRRSDAAASLCRFRDAQHCVSAACGDRKRASSIPALARGCDPRRRAGDSPTVASPGPSPTQRRRRPPWAARGVREVACRPPAGIASARVDPRATPAASRAACGVRRRLATAARVVDPRPSGGAPRRRSDPATPPRRTRRAPRRRAKGRDGRAARRRTGTPACGAAWQGTRAPPRSGALASLR